MKRIGRPKTNAYLDITRENWTQIKGKEVDKDLRKILPKKSDIWDKTGNLKISPQEFESLKQKLDEARRIPKNKRNKIDMPIFDTINEIKEYRDQFSPEVKAQLASLELDLRLMEKDLILEIQNQLKAAGILKANVTYDVQSFWALKNYSDSNELDFDKVKPEDYSALYSGWINGDISMTNIKYNQFKKVYVYLFGEQSGILDEYNYLKYGDSVKIERKAQQLAYIVDFVQKVNNSNPFEF